MNLILKEVTKTEVTLRKGSVKTKTENTYRYESEDGVVKLQFHAHPTQAWCYVSLPGGTNPAGLKIFNAAVEKWVELAMDFVNTKFDNPNSSIEQAVATLPIKA